jgi:hypothetical protein
VLCVARGHNLQLDTAIIIIRWLSRAACWSSARHIPGSLVFLWKGFSKEAQLLDNRKVPIKFKQKTDGKTDKNRHLVVLPDTVPLVPLIDSEPETEDVRVIVVREREALSKAVPLFVISETDPLRVSVRTDKHPFVTKFL